MNHGDLRICALAGLLFAPLLVHAHEERPVTSRPAAPASTQRLSSAAALGVHSLSLDSVSSESMAFIVDIEQPLSRFLSVFAGGHVGMNLRATGLQAGGRLYLTGRPFQGPFLALQGDGTLIDGGDDVSMRRASVSGLIGYSQQVGRQWHIALSGGAGYSHLRQETVMPRSAACTLFAWCLLSEPERTVQRSESLHPVVRLTAVHRF
ncbi:hypothetical protein A176_004872 [Myxococcus hansupus]|uniref:Uncharacterized protein n=1 Tax=Pseudomyxococcus hansupus TaxID=1297742 RepID=A0A0H4X2T7_9BACT|nr:hypothetical protein [Myxococcus hansupus]AKQ67960.1 hypothetical protein A176_004872 [Myxococcus hansupus]